MLDQLRFPLELSATNVTGEVEDVEMDDLVARQLLRSTEGLLTDIADNVLRLVLHFHVAPNSQPAIVHVQANSAGKFAVYAVCFAVKIQGGRTGKGFQTDGTFEAFSRSMMLQKKTSSSRQKKRRSYLLNSN